MTVVIEVDPNSPGREAIKRAVALIASGGSIAYPTDTVYGLGVSALDSCAVLRAFQVKQRPLSQPIPVAVGDAEMAERLAIFKDEARRLTEVFWPGALTLVLLRKPLVPLAVTAGRTDIAVRVPCHQVPLQIIAESMLPLTATSANIHGKPSCREAHEVLEQLGGQVDLVLDGGRTPGMASTILDLTGHRPRVLREGPVTREAIARVLGLVIE
jgi:L-threonylcarbamoyladenylate synthase